MNTYNLRIAILILFFVGLVVQIYLSFSYWVGGDQLHLLDLGAKLAYENELLGYSKLKEGGGANLGSLMQLLVAGPLYLWENFRSPMLIPLMFSVVSYFLVSSVIKETYGDYGVLLFTIFYWLSATRLYNTGFLWEPAYLSLPAAMHLVSYFWLKKIPKHFGYTVIHVFALFLLVQIHNSALILGLASMYLLFRGKLKLEWKGVAVGSVMGLIFFIPLILDLLQGGLPAIGSSSGYFGKGFVNVAPFLKGIFYMFKLSGVDGVRSLKETIFWDGDYSYLIIILQLLSVFTVVLGIYSVWCYIRGFFFKKWQQEREDLSSAQSCLADYWLAVFFGMAISAGLSPITLQEWMVVVSLFATVLPMIHFFNNRNRFGNKSRYFLGVFAAISLLIIAVVAMGQEKFNRNQDLPDIDDKNVLERVTRLFL